MSPIAAVGSHEGQSVRIVDRWFTVPLVLALDRATQGARAGDHPEFTRPKGAAGAPIVSLSLSLSLFLPLCLSSLLLYYCAVFRC